MMMMMMLLCVFTVLGSSLSQRALHKLRIERGRRRAGFGAPLEGWEWGNVAAGEREVAGVGNGFVWLLQLHSICREGIL